jgi:ribosomal protein S21
MEVRKKENESSSSLIYRFTKKTQQGGVLREVRKRRFHARKVSRIKRRASAIHRSRKKAEYERAKKLGSA